MLAVGARAIGSTSRERVLLVVCVLVWALGAALGAGGGLWIGAGGAAIVLGTLVSALQPVVLRELRPRLLDLGLGAVVGVAMAALTHVLYATLGQVAPWIPAGTAELYRHFEVFTPVVAALVLLPIILGEELVWRGLVQRAISHRVAGVAAVLLAALIYALAHAPSGKPVLVLAALGCGLVWSTLRASTDGLAAPLVAHIVWDYLVLLIWPVRL